MNVPKTNLLNTSTAVLILRDTIGHTIGRKRNYSAEIKGGFISSSKLFKLFTDTELHHCLCRQKWGK